MIISVLLLVATLWPTPGAPQPFERLCIICGSLGGIDFVANVVIFVPLGIALVHEAFGLRRAVVFGALLSALVEALQWRLVPGRDSSLGDLLTNSLGTLLGGILGLHWRSLLFASRARCHRFTLIWLGAVLGIAGIAAWSLRLAAPDLIFFSQWAPVRGGYVPFAGRIVSLRLFGESIPVATKLEPSKRGHAFGRGEIDLEALIEGADVRAAGTALIARLGNPIGEQAQLAQRGEALLFRARHNGTRLGLRSPTFLLDSGFAAAPSRTRIRARARNGVVQLEGVGSRTHAVTLGRFWHTLAPFEVRSQRFDPLMFAAFLGGLFLPVGYLARRSGAAIVWIAGIAGVPVSLGLIPLLAGIAPWGTWELIGACTGLALGALVSRRAVT